MRFVGAPARLLRVFAAAARDLRLYPLRSMLVAVSLAVGVFAVVGVSVVGVVARDVFVSKEEQTTARAPAYLAEVTGDRSSLGSLGLRVAALRGGVAPTGVLKQEIRALVVVGPGPGRPPVGETGLTWYLGDLPVVHRWPVLAGGWPDDVTTVYPPAVVANQAAADLLGGVGTQVGVAAPESASWIAGTLVGIVADGRPEPQLYSRLPTALTLAPGMLPAQATILLHGPGLDEQTSNQLVSDLAVDTRSEVTSPARRFDSVPEVSSQLDAQQKSFAVTALVALAVAALGILNIGLAGVRERSRELTIRRAVGATRWEIFASVVLSSLLIALTVAAAALLLAAVGVQSVPRFFPPDSPLEPPAFPREAAVWACLAATGTAAIGAAVPAWIAARLDPADSLRE